MELIQEFIHGQELTHIVVDIIDMVVVHQHAIHIQISLNVYVKTDTITLEQNVYPADLLAPLVVVKPSV